MARRRSGSSQMAAVMAKTTSARTTVKARLAAPKYFVEIAGVAAK